MVGVPYESCFTLPEKIPAVIGQSTLAKFPDAAQLNSYVGATMPFWKPGSLTKEEAWEVTAFILRKNGLWDDVKELNEFKAGDALDPRMCGTQYTALSKGIWREAIS